jgi:hypothetical protein
VKGPEIAFCVLGVVACFLPFVPIILFRIIDGIGHMIQRRGEP